MGNGLHLVDILDHFVANFGLVLIGLIECIILGWMYTLHRLRKHANETSEIKIGKWWEYLIKIVIPVVLITLLVMSIINNITDPYMGYPWWVIIGVGVIPVVSIVIISLILSKIRNKEATT
jgi:NSS family neurotransmitter:Na+ symporter